MTVTFPAVDPAALEAVLSLEAIKRHLRLDASDTAEDAYLGELRAAAFDEAQRHCGLSFVAGQTVREDFDGFPDICPRTGRVQPLRLSSGPAVVVTAMTYLDSAGAEQAYDFATLREKVQGFHRVALAPAVGSTWPATYNEEGAVTVTYTAGFAVADLPPVVSHALKSIVAHWYENRETVLVGSIQATLPQLGLTLLAPLRPPVIG